MSRIGLALMLMFAAASLYLGFFVDGAHLLALIAWPFSILAFVICTPIADKCIAGNYALYLVILFGLIQYYLIGVLASALIKRFRTASKH